MLHLLKVYILVREKRDCQKDIFSIFWNVAWRSRQAVGSTCSLLYFLQLALFMDKQDPKLTSTIWDTYDLSWIIKSQNWMLILLGENQRFQQEKLTQNWILKPTLCPIACSTFRSSPSTHLQGMISTENHTLPCPSTKFQQALRIAWFCSLDWWKIWCWNMRIMHVCRKSCWISLDVSSPIPVSFPQPMSKI